MTKKRKYIKILFVTKSDIICIHCFWGFENLKKKNKNKNSMAENSFRKLSMRDAESKDILKSPLGSIRYSIKVYDLIDKDHSIYG